MTTPVEPKPISLRFIGDVHGVYGPYLSLISGAAHTIQVGDLGFDYLPLAKVDATRHVAIAGNHDWHGPTDHLYRNWRECPGFLGDFGLHRVPGFPPIFYARGAWSIDGALRRSWAARGERASWWPEEEMSEAELSAAHGAYVAARPEIVVTHEAPICLLEMGLLGDPRFARQFGYDTNAIPTRTNRALQGMLEAWRPKLWVFGHMHQRVDVTVGGTRFVCLDMIRGNTGLAGAYLDLEPGTWEETRP